MEALNGQVDRMCVLMICIIQALRFQNDRIHGLFKLVIMTNYDFDEIALTKTIDFTAFLKMNWMDPGDGVSGS